MVERKAVDFWYAYRKGLDDEKPWLTKIELQSFQVLRKMSANGIIRIGLGNQTILLLRVKRSRCFPVEFRWYHECTLRPKNWMVCFFV